MARIPRPAPGGRLATAPAPLAVAVIALAAGGALIGVALAGPSPVDRGPGPTSAQQGLRSFDSCARLAGYARRHRDAVGPYATGGMPPIEDGGMRAAEAAAPVAAGESGHSPTNVQEQGVDEPDLVKSDGAHIFAIAGRRLEAVDARAGEPAVVGSLVLPRGPGDDVHAWGHELLLAGQRALVISRADLGRAPWTRTVLTVIDVSDPAAMRALQTMTVDGAYVSARLTGTTARVVTSTSPGVRPGSMPEARLHDRAVRTVNRSPLMPCEHVSKPARFSGLEMLSVLTIDLSRGLDPIDTDAVMTGGQVVYGSPQSLYIASERWLDPTDAGAHASRISTAIHRFDVTDPQSTTYRATGRVPGFMLSQWSMSEREGLLRVAATTAPPWTTGGGAAESESFVSVLGERSGRLVEVGRVGDLGRGEQIFAVRFIGETGYVVTFRQVDPLYTLDLSDPAEPRALGELKIPGYSAYLHPVGPGALLGVGQDASGQGSLLGAQLSLFDVSDLTRPTRIDRHSLGQSSDTEIEYDHHAFLWWEPAALAVVPVEVYGGPRHDFLGALAVRVTQQGGIERLRRISHGDGWRAAIRRSLVVGDRLFTYSARGVMVHDLATLADAGWAEFTRGLGPDPAKLSGCVAGGSSPRESWSSSWSRARS
ncbi:MAG: beta-propeller domain-containing protein [Solirubrobacterales bacterium]